MGAILIGTSLSLPATAAPPQGGFHGGGFHGGGFRDRGFRFGGPAWWGVGLGLGLGWEAATIGGPYYYPAYPVYEYPPIYYYPDSLPPAAVQASAPPSAQAAPNWYYCNSAKGYYPYVPQCPEPWRIVPATPPGSTR